MYTNQAAIDCPFCIQRIGVVDNKKHLHVNFEKRVYHCFKCGAKPSLTGKLSQIDYSDEMLKFHIKKREVAKKENLDLNYISRPIEKGSRAYDYLRSRNISEDTIRDRRIRQGVIFYDEGKPNYKWSERILFPFFDRKGVYYIVGRSYIGKEPRYINTSGSKGSIVYSVESIVNRECIVCEGIFSALAASRHTGISSVAILGKTITEFQVAKLKKYASKVYLCLDGGVDTKDVTRKMMSQSLKVETISLPEEKDPDEINSEDFRLCFSKRKKLSYLDTLKW